MPILLSAGSGTRGYYTQRFFSDDDTMGASFIDLLAESYRASMPLVHFLNRAITGG
jgi:hypothetical protein